jgi:hypothetical protein
MSAAEVWLEEVRAAAVAPTALSGAESARVAHDGPGVAHDGLVAARRSRKRARHVGCSSVTAMNNVSTFAWITSFAFACTAGCVTGTDEELEVEEATGELTDSSGWRQAAVLTIDGTRGTRYCMGTIVGARHVLTAASCDPRIGDRVLFYAASGELDEASDRTIASIHNPPGVDGRTGDLTESGGDFADMTIVRIGEARPAGTRVAIAAWSYPSGGDDWGDKVGIDPEAPSRVQVLSDLTYSDHDNDGHFLTENQQTVDHDRGGPFYDRRGVLHGSVWEWESRDKYASVAERSDFVVGNLGFVWSGGITVHGRRLTGTMIEMFTGSWQVCQYACQHTSGCVGVSRENFTRTCRLFSSLGAPRTDFDYTAAER